MVVGDQGSVSMTDEEFVRGIFDACYRRLVGQLYAICGDLATAEDVGQEAFVRALDHARAFHRTDSPEAWLRRVAINIQRSRWRRMRTYAGLQHKLVERVSPFEPSPDHADMIRALAALPVGQREVIVLHHLVDLSVDEVAAGLGVPVGTVKTRLVRGRTALAGLLSEPDEERHV
jgi:RNA polymerase sigma-70 factor (ECF subfamily)